MKNTKNIRIRCLGMLLVSAAVLSACTGGAGTVEPELADELTYEDVLSMTPAAPGSQAQPSSTPVFTVTEEGLTYEDMRRTNPPPPLELKVQVVGAGVRLDWEPAEAVTIAHDYSDTVIEYRVYRRTDAVSPKILIGTSQDLFYVDETVEAGITYHYSVSAMHEGPLEGAVTEEVIILVP